MGGIRNAGTALRNKFLNRVSATKPDSFRWISRLVSLCLVGMFFSAPALQTANARDGSLVCVGDEAEVTISCDFRLAEKRDLRQLTVTFNDAPPAETPVYTRYTDTSPVSAWLFLLDRTDPGRAATVDAGKAMVANLLANASEKRLMGVATFTDELRMELPVASGHAQINERLDTIVADGQATQFYSSIIEAINVLDDVNADRKGLVILSDGKAEDTAFTYEDVVNAARASNVTVIGMGYALRPSDTPSLQGIRRLSVETGGAYSQIIGQQDFDQEFLDDFINTLENGGTVDASLKDVVLPVEVTLAIESTAGEVVTLQETFDRVALFGRNLDIPLIAQLYSIFGAEQGDWAKENQPIAWLLPIILLLIVSGFLGFFFLVRKPVIIGDYPGQEHPAALHHDDQAQLDSPPLAIEDGSEEPEIIDPVTEGVDFGFFEVVGSEATIFPITATSVSIGRHSDNDIRLTNTSVHRYHAHLHVSPAGDVTIQDLGYENGVVVNGDLIEKAILKPGDIIELGEVGLRFVKQ